jgi:hypothetical protein
MARRGGISPHDHAGVAAFYYQLLQFYQADSSSYSTEASHTGEKPPTKRDKTFDNIYARENDDDIRAASKVDDADSATSYAGFLQFAEPTVADAVAALTKMFANVGDSAMKLAFKESGSRKAEKKAKPAEPTVKEEEPPIDLFDEDSLTSLFGADSPDEEVVT